MLQECSNATPGGGASECTRLMQDQCHIDKKGMQRVFASQLVLPSVWVPSEYPAHVPMNRLQEGCGVMRSSVAVNDLPDKRKPRLFCSNG